MATGDSTSMASGTLNPLMVSSTGKKKKNFPDIEETKEQLKELGVRKDFLSMIAKPSLKNAADSRRRYDYEWMVRDLFRRGYHFSRYQPTTNTVVLASRQTAKVPINIIAAQMRSIRNQVTSFRPKFEVLPRYTSTESQTQARYSGRLLDYVFEHLNFKNKIKRTVTQGLMFSIGGPWQIVYDEEKKEIRVWLCDPFDFYFDPLAEEDEDCEYMIKATRRPMTEVLTNKMFDMAARKEITGAESRLAVSEYKQFMIQTLHYVNQYNMDENKSVILFEGSFKIRDEDTGKVHIRNVVWTDQNTRPLYWEDTDNDEFDYVIYHADLNPNEILGEGWMKNVLPMNRVLDSLESSVYEYNYRVAKGRIVVDKDSGVRSIHNVHGEIISKNKGAEVRALDMPALPIAVERQIERINRYIEDIGGAHDASLGRVPAGVKSGVGVAELRQADSTNQDDLVDNLEDFLSAVGHKILKKIAKHYSTYKIIYDLGYRENESKYFAVVGSGAKKKGNTDKAHKGQVKIGPDWVDLAIIGEDNNIRVTVGSWLGYTKEMMQQKTMDLARAGLIDQKTFLRLWEFGSIDQIVQQTRIESLLKKNMNQGSPDPMHPGEQDQYGLAMTENEMMVNENKDMPVDAHDDHLVHVALHQEALGQGQDDLVGKHIAIHQMYLGQGPTQGDASAANDQLRNDAVSTQGGQPPPPGEMPPGMMPGGMPMGGAPVNPMAGAGQMPPDVGPMG